jgi:hypothetical protein
MALAIETFSNVKGGNALYKAVSHPAASSGARALARRLERARAVAVYDPLGFAEAFAVFHDVSRAPVAAAFVQNVADIGRPVLGRPARPVTDLKAAAADLVFVAAFDASRLIDHIRHLLPDGAEVASLDEMRLPEEMVTRPGAYLDGLNFATNFAFFRDGGGRHTRLVTANYWAAYGAAAPTLWFTLFGGDGRVLAEWREALASGPRAIVVDSAEVRRRFKLGEFAGQLFVHATGIAGHDVVKYALDTFDDDGRELSCTHDANAWPADRYAGLPAPDAGERVVLWVQNSHPRPIPPRSVGLCAMGSDEVAWLDREVAGFGSAEVDVGALLPGLRWPQQLEVRAGKHFVRPRYEVTRRGARPRIAHVNVERTDLKPDPGIAELGNLMGKGFILPAPILPPDRWRTLALPTPMATCQDELPIAAIAHDATGREVARLALGRLPRSHATAIDLAGPIASAGGLPSGYGHLELVYDLAHGGAADGWLHALFRYEDRASGHAAETSFGAHIFNTVLTYKGEPQSYVNRPPGLSTRLFLRLGAAPLDTLCHLIYPASTPWRARSATALILNDGDGVEVARRNVDIPCGGSYLWRYGEAFGAAERRRAGVGAYVVVRDATCRLFGYHGLIGGAGAFSLDHMFGF